MTIEKTKVTPLAQMLIAIIVISIMRLISAELAFFVGAACLMYLIIRIYWQRTLFKSHSESEKTVDYMGLALNAPRTVCLRTIALIGIGSYGLEANSKAFAIIAAEVAVSTIAVLINSLYCDVHNHNSSHLSGEYANGDNPLQFFSILISIVVIAILAYHAEKYAAAGQISYAQFGAAGAITLALLVVSVNFMIYADMPSQMHARWTKLLAEIDQRKTQEMLDSVKEQIEHYERDFDARQEASLQLHALRYLESYDPPEYDVEVYSDIREDRHIANNAKTSVRKLPHKGVKAYPARPKRIPT